MRSRGGWFVPLLSTGWKHPNMHKHKQTGCLETVVDPDLMAPEEAILSGSTMFQKGSLSGFNRTFITANI